jgi:prevent-host-death family protein
VLLRQCSKNSRASPLPPPEVFGEPGGFGSQLLVDPCEFGWRARRYCYSRWIEDLYNVQNIARFRAFQELAMGISASDVIPLSTARANFSELAEEVKAGAEKIVTKNGESYIALIDAQRLDYYHQLERERIHLLLIDEAAKGLDDVAEGRVKDARSAISALKRRRSA